MAKPPILLIQSQYDPRISPEKKLVNISYIIESSYIYTTSGITLFSINILYIYIVKCQCLPVLSPYPHQSKYNRTTATSRVDPRKPCSKPLWLPWNTNCCATKKNPELLMVSNRSFDESWDMSARLFFWIHGYG